MTSGALMYYVQKEGVYRHGVYWIGADRAEAIAAADSLAVADCDSYHTWIVCQGFEPDCTVVYSVMKQEPDGPDCTCLSADPDAPWSQHSADCPVYLASASIDKTD